MTLNRGQENYREDAVVDAVGLIDAGEGPYGADAADEIGTRYEIKTTIREGYRLATSTTLGHIEKYKSIHWLFGKGVLRQKQFVLTNIYYLTPEQITPFIDTVEEKILYRLSILDMVRPLNEDMLKTLDSKQLSEYNQFIKNGMSLVSPPVPHSYVVANGYELQCPYGAHLAEIRKSLIETGLYTPKHTFDKFWI